jgi:hypothetical protein
MAQTYLLFDFGADEAKVQQARHKLDGWRQAFRLDKKLQFKFDRGESPAPETNAKTDKAAAESPKAKTAKPKGKTKAAETSAAEQNGDVKLLVRLYFSPHEKLSEQRWIDRIPSEEPFKGASPKVVQEGAAEFADVLSRFDSLD